MRAPRTIRQPDGIRSKRRNRFAPEDFRLRARPLRCSRNRAAQPRRARAAEISAIAARARHHQKPLWRVEEVAKSARRGPILGAKADARSADAVRSIARSRAVARASP